MDNILNIPSPTKEQGQRSLSVTDAYFTRFIPTWSMPSSLTANQWRTWARMQPIASDCKDILIASLESLEWKVTPRDSDMRDELKATVKYYTRLFEQGGNWLGLDWTGLLEWLMNDLQDLPFGAAVEIGRKNDAPEGRVAWFKPLDAGTLYPTLNANYPVVQWYANAVEPIWFPKHAIARMYMNPRPEIEREGWGMAPPERVYMALEMLSRGDSYYANLLVDVPPAGILDLMDMAKDEAIEWINSFRTFVANGGVDGFKIPVLYEHTQDVKFIPFGKVPNEIMYDSITLKYAALVTASYGMTLGDIGLQAQKGGETLAGGIRDERKTRKTGLARSKKKIKFFFESILPPTLQFDFVDMDDELATALGRARLANATAWGQLIDKGVFDRKEARLQTIQDGLVTISLPEDPPTKDDWAEQKAKVAMQAKAPLLPNGKPQERPGMLGNPQAPSQGGDGEVKKSVSVKKSRAFSGRISKFAKRICENVTPILLAVADGHNEDSISILKSTISDVLYGDDDIFGLGEIVKSTFAKDAWDVSIDDDIEKDIWEILTDWVDEADLQAVDMKSAVAELKYRISSTMKELIGKSFVEVLKNYVLTERVFDSSFSVDYDNIVEIMRGMAKEQFEQYANAAISIEIENTINEIKNKSGVENVTVS